jgi:hypothetical protein
MICEGGGLLEQFLGLLRDGLIAGSGAIGLIHVTVAY